MSKDEYLITDAPLKALTVFAMPMILGSFFQQVYNMADSIIVGQFVGSSALAAVGACAALTNVFICVALGAGVGAGVLVSRYFGAKSYGKMKTIVSTSLISFLVLSVVLGVFGFCSSHFMMSTVIKYILQAGLHIVVGKIVAGKIQQFVGDQIDPGVVVCQGAHIRQVARRKHILQAGGGVIAAVRHDLNIYFRVNAVHLLNKGFYFLIRCHKGNGLVLCFRFALRAAAAAGGKRCRGGCNAASLQKRAAGDLLHHINILPHMFGDSTTQVQ